MTDLPADRYIEEALRKVNSVSPSAQLWTLREIADGKDDARYCRAVIELARMIEKYEPIPEPVDPDVEIVKEAKASLCIGLQYGDPLPSVDAVASRAIKLAREKGAL